MNLYLNKVNKEVQHLSMDLNSGETFKIFLSLLADKKIPGKFVQNPSFKIHKLANLKLCLDFLKNEGVEIHNIQPEDIEKGDLKTINSLMKFIAIHYLLLQGKSSGNAKNVAAMKKTLLSWVKEKTKSIKINVKDFHNSFQDGNVFQAIFNNMTQDTLALLDEKDTLKRHQTNMSSFSIEFNIPTLITAENLNTYADEISVMMYLTYLKQVDETKKPFELIVDEKNLEQKTPPVTPRKTTSKTPRFEETPRETKPSWIGMTPRKSPNVVPINKPVQEEQKPAWLTTRLKKIEQSPRPNSNPTEQKIEEKKLDKSFFKLNSFLKIKKKSNSIIEVKNESKKIEEKSSDSKIEVIVEKGYLKDENQQIGEIDPLDYSIDIPDDIFINRDSIFKLKSKTGNLSVTDEKCTIKIIGPLESFMLGHIYHSNPTMKDSKMTIHPKYPGSYLIAISINEKLICEQPRYFVVKSTPRWSIEGLGAQNNLVKGLTYSFFIKCENEPKIKELQCILDAPVEHEKCKLKIINVTKNTLKIIYTPVVSGVYKFSISVNGEKIQENPLIVNVVDSSPLINIINEVDVETNLCKLVLTGTYEVYKESKIHLKSIDRNGLLKKFSSDKFDISITSLNENELVEVFIENDDSGIYSINFTPKIHGSHQLNVLFCGKHISNSPFSFQVQKPLWFAHGKGLSGLLTVGEETNFVVERTLNNSEKVKKVNCEMKGPVDSKECEMTIKSSKKGKYEFTYTPKVEGEYELQLYINDEMIAGSPFKIQVKTKEYIKMKYDRLKLISKYQKFESQNVKNFLYWIDSSIHHLFSKNVIEYNTYEACLEHKKYLSTFSIEKEFQKSKENLSSIDMLEGLWSDLENIHDFHEKKLDEKLEIMKKLESSNHKFKVKMEKLEDIFGSLGIEPIKEEHFETEDSIQNGFQKQKELKKKLQKSDEKVKEITEMNLEYIKANHKNAKNNEHEINKFSSLSKKYHEIIEENEKKLLKIQLTIKEKLSKAMNEYNKKSIEFIDWIQQKIVHLNEDIQLISLEDQLIQFEYEQEKIFRIGSEKLMKLQEMFEENFKVKYPIQKIEIKLNSLKLTMEEKKAKINYELDKQERKIKQLLFAIKSTIVSFEAQKELVKSQKEKLDLIKNEKEMEEFEVTFDLLNKDSLEFDNDFQELQIGFQQIQQLNHSLIEELSTEMEKLQSCNEATKSDIEFINNNMKKDFDQPNEKEKSIYDEIQTILTSASNFLLDIVVGSSLDELDDLDKKYSKIGKELENLSIMIELAQISDILEETKENDTQNEINSIEEKLKIEQELMFVRLESKKSELENLRKVETKNIKIQTKFNEFRTWISNLKPNEENIHELNTKAKKLISMIEDLDSKSKIRKENIEIVQRNFIDQFEESQKNQNIFQLLSLISNDNETVSEDDLIGLGMSNDILENLKQKLTFKDNLYYFSNLK
eukprot:gene2309-2777_t